MQGTQGTTGGHQGWLADSCHPSACNRAGSPNPNSWRQSQRVPRPPWSLWVSGQRDGGCWAGWWVLGWGCRLGGCRGSRVGVQGELCQVPLAALAHALLFLCLFLPLPVLSSRRRLLLLSAALWAPLPTFLVPMSSWLYVPCVPVSKCPCIPMPTHLCVPVSLCPMSLYSHTHHPLSQ